MKGNVERRMTVKKSLVMLSLLLFCPGHLLSGPYDEAYFGAKWLDTLKNVRSSVRGELIEEKKKLSPWDVPYVRELGHLYYLEQKDFSRLIARLPSRTGGDIITEYYFFKDRLSMVRVLHKYEKASFQGLLESLEADYGKPKKETSRNLDDVFVQHTFSLPKLIMEVSYHPYKIEGG